MEEKTQHFCEERHSGAAFTPDKAMRKTAALLQFLFNWKNKKQKITRCLNKVKANSKLLLETQCQSMLLRVSYPWCSAMPVSLSMAGVTGPWLLQVLLGCVSCCPWHPLAEAWPFLWDSAAR